MKKQLEINDIINIKYKDSYIKAKIVGKEGYNDDMKRTNYGLLLADTLKEIIVNGEELEKMMKESDDLSIK